MLKHEKLYSIQLFPFKDLYAIFLHKFVLVIIRSQTCPRGRSYLYLPPAYGTTMK